MTGDESRCFQFNPETKRRSIEWRSKNSPDQRKSAPKTRRWISCQSFFFFSSYGFVSQGVPATERQVNDLYYKGVVESLLNCIRRVRPKLIASSDWHLCTIMPPLIRPSSWSFLKEKGITVLEQATYSPDLTLADFMLFPPAQVDSQKEELWRHSRQSAKCNSWAERHSFFKSLKRHCGTCIVAVSAAVYGELFEGR